MMKGTMLVAAGALAVAACGNAGEKPEDLQNQSGMPIDGKALAEVLGTAVDEKAVEGMARQAIEGAVNEGLRELFPMEEIDAVRGVLDEDALAQELSGAIDPE